MNGTRAGALCAAGAGGGGEVEGGEGCAPANEAKNAHAEPATMLKLARLMNPLDGLNIVNSLANRRALSSRRVVFGFASAKYLSLGQTDRILAKVPAKTVCADQR